MTLDRRTLIQSAAGAFVLGGAAPRFSFAATQGDRRLIVVILRGAMDGLAAVPPHGDADYVRVRGALALSKGQGGIADLDGSFGLHPALATLKSFWDQKQLAVVHAVASPYRDRSHFDGQNVIETGALRPNGLPDGWLNRAMGPLGINDPKLALAIAQSVPVILQGRRDVSSWMPIQLPQADDDFIARLKILYANDPLFRGALDNAIEVDAVASASGAPMDPNMMRGARGYRFEPLAKMAGNLIAAEGGPTITVLEVSGWDTHQAQGTTEGRLNYVLGDFDKGLKALAEAVRPIWDRTTILAFTEFGRTVAPNGSGGTDHGTASAAFVAGGAVNGGRVVAQWPGLRALYQGRDLAPTMDLRAVFKGVLGDHMRVARGQLDAIFPDTGNIAPTSGLIKA
jgi:uncharacterized protein (DUF1501 family)